MVVTEKVEAISSNDWNVSESGRNRIPRNPHHTSQNNSAVPTFRRPTPLVRVPQPSNSHGGRTSIGVLLQEPDSDWNIIASRIGARLLRRVLGQHC